MSKGPLDDFLSRAANDCINAVVNVECAGCHILFPASEATRYFGLALCFNCADKNSRQWAELARRER